MIKCPHCNNFILIEAIACKIFRHGVYKINYQQISPHSSLEECTRLKSEDLIFGCGGPFYFDGEIVRKCDYI